MLEKFVPKRNKGERLFLDKRDGMPLPLHGGIASVWDKRGHAFKLFNLMVPQTKVERSERITRGSGSSHVLKNKEWMLERMQKALKDWKGDFASVEGGGKMLMEKLAAISQKMMPIPRIG